MLRAGSDALGFVVAGGFASEVLDHIATPKRIFVPRPGFKRLQLLVRNVLCENIVRCLLVCQLLGLFSCVACLDCVTSFMKRMSACLLCTRHL